MITGSIIYCRQNKLSILTFMPQCSILLVERNLIKTTKTMMTTRKRISSPNEIIDPVCQMKVPPDRKHITSTFNQQRYYFCAEACRKSFKLNPDKYLAQKSPKRKGWWGRYLERLNKATGGEPPKCH